jgi:Protein of unknown function (DUF2905)
MPVEPFREIGKLLLLVGILIAVVGAWFAFGGRLPFRVGRLPGDVYYHGRHGSFYFPIATCILLSVLLTLAFWIVNLFRR